MLVRHVDKRHVMACCIPLEPRPQLRPFAIFQQIYYFHFIDMLSAMQSYKK